jgi:hypothetical protein
MRKTTIPRALLAALLVAVCAGALVAGQDEVFDKAFSMDGVTRLSIENVNGKVEAFAPPRARAARAPKKPCG